MIKFHIQLINQSGVFRSGQIIADDWDAAYSDLLEVQETLSSGEWINCQIYKYLVPSEILRKLP